MSRQNLSQQTADRLYTTIVVEQHFQPGEKPLDILAPILYYIVRQCNRNHTTD